MWKKVADFQESATFLRKILLKMEVINSCFF